MSSLTHRHTLAGAGRIQPCTLEDKSPLGATNCAAERGFRGEVFPTASDTHSSPGMPPEAGRSMYHDLRRR